MRVLVQPVVTLDLQGSQRKGRVVNDLNFHRSAANEERRALYRERSSRGRRVSTCTSSLVLVLVLRLLPYCTWTVVHVVHNVTTKERIGEVEMNWMWFGIIEAC
jgi:hypothetical protein